MESLKRALESIGRMWSTLSVTQRVVVGGAALLMAVLLVVSSVGTTQAWVRVAGPEVDAASRAAILKKLQERNQKHDVRGSEILVPKEDADRIVLELAGEGTVNTNAVFKFLEQSNIWDTRWDKEKKLQIAYQTKLESMIRSIESVRNAAVVINPGSTNYQLGFAGPKPSAAVTVEIKDGMELSPKNVRAITGLVSRAVAGVEEDMVLIMDSKGKSYRAGAMDHYENELSREKVIRENIKNSLIEYPNAAVVVRVQESRKSTKLEEVIPTKPVIVETMESKKVRKGIGSAPSGVRKGEGESVVEPGPGSDEIDTQNSEKGIAGTRKTVEDAPAGGVERITVAVRIPIDEGALVEARRQLPELRDFVLKAAGPPARMEDISVQLFPTKKPEQTAAVVPTPGAVDWLSANWPKLILGIFVLAALGGVLRTIQRAGTQETVEELQALTTALTEEREAAVEIGGAGESDLGRLKQGLQEMVGRNPQSVAASLKSFMSGR
jgi:flagellar biosynthesis/type III secretory pathway M-ring protein FliF/YscJ